MSLVVVRRMLFGIVVVAIGMVPFAPLGDTSPTASAPVLPALSARALSAGIGAGVAAAADAGPPGTAYVANEASGSISVIDTATNTITATICLGSDRLPLPDALGAMPALAGPCNAGLEAPGNVGPQVPPFYDFLRPLYNGHLGAHGLWLTPDGTVLLVANRISGTIVAIDTTVPCTTPADNPRVGCTNAILGYRPVGREPHLLTVRPGHGQGGREGWVAVRGEKHLDVLDLDAKYLFDPNLPDDELMRQINLVPTLNGPSMVTFTSDGKFAFVCHAKQNIVLKINADSKNVVASQPVVATFSPFCLVTPDDQELYVIHKTATGSPPTGMLTILRTSDLSPVVQGLPIGDCANHVAFIGKLAYITIGGTRPCAPAGVDRPGAVVIVDRPTHTIANRLTGPAWTGDPHGIWPAADRRRLLIGHERGNRITVLDTKDPDNPTDDVIVRTIADPTFTKQPIDIVTKSPGAAVYPAGGTEGTTLKPATLQPKEGATR